MRTDPSSAIRQTLIDFNNAVHGKDADRAYAVFDRDARIILAGSAINEIHRGNDSIKKFLRSFLSNSFRVSWDLTHTSVDQNGETAWVFVDGKVTIQEDAGGQTVMPYRITVVMVQREGQWKWRLFSGSVPQLE